ncbi:hypothetical protein JG688_00013821 [Phytophthora aleatoria]|uniref:Uncharacterized protein n=1 Tax=Phytophthora aleatoria TaxID=2496075 RepID=A0A8J5IGW9_9STRA|nr:hypothetical protein JG688_00013821 [Phytophthora aleatoria]
MLLLKILVRNGSMVEGSNLRPIAVILRPKEYRDTLERWLCKNKMGLDLLRNDLDDERRYRQAFAYTPIGQLVLPQRFDTYPPPPGRYRSRSRSMERYKIGREMCQANVGFIEEEVHRRSLVVMTTVYCSPGTTT